MQNPQAWCEADVKASFPPRVARRTSCQGTVAAALGPSAVAGLKDRSRALKRPPPGLGELSLGELLSRSIQATADQNTTSGNPMSLEVNKQGSLLVKRIAVHFTGLASAEARI